MRVLNRYAIAFGFILASTPAIAQGTSVGSLWKEATPPAAKKPNAKSARADTSARPKRSGADSAAAALATTVRLQTDTIAALKAKLAEKAAQPAARGPQPEVLAARIDSLVAVQAAATKQSVAVNQKLAGLGNFKFTGDVRVRYEGQFQGGGSASRHRERTRARIAIGANVGDDVTGAIGFTSGALDDVQSANQTQSGFYSRKSVAFDRFFITWKPKSIAGLTVTGGKFPYAWDRTSLTFGNDIMPEGVAASYARTTKGALQSATVAGYFLPFLEVTSGADAYVSGAQLATKWKVSKKTIVRLSGQTVEFRGADAVALAAIAGSIKPSSPNTNRYRTDSTGKVLGYASGFAYTDVIAGVDFTQSAKWPVTLQADVVRNRRASTDENTALWTDLRVGRLSQVRDAQATWSYIQIERDAVLGPFIEQDLRAATNAVSHKLAIAYQWRSNATIGLGAWYGRLLDPTATPKLATPGNLTACSTAPFTGCRDPWLSRVQIDLSYRF